MNTGDDDLEKLLSKLAPAPPAPELMKRLRAARPEIAEEPPAEDKIVPFRRWLPAAAVAAAACVAAIVLIERNATVPADVTITPPPSLPSFPVPEDDPGLEKPRETMVPVETRQHLMEVADYGIVEDKSKKPVRLIATTWVDEFVYAANGEGKPVTESRVRQEILPVSVRTY